MTAGTTAWITRRRWDYYFLPAVVAALGICGWSAFVSGEAEARDLGWVLLIVALWAYLRWHWPSQGTSVATIAGTPGAVPMLWWSALSLLLFGGWMLFYKLLIEGPDTWPVLVGVSGAWIIIH